MIKIIFVPTWKCNLSCSYCYYKVSHIDKGGYKLSLCGHEREVGQELGWQDWLAYLDRFAPFHLEITGGEPLMYHDLAKITESLPNGCKWSITSNTLLTEAVRKISKKDCVCWTASYHYGEDDKFLYNLVMLRKAGIYPKVTLVITPGSYALALRKIEWFTGMGYGVNVHPVQDMTDVWQGLDDLWNEIQCMQGVNVVRNIPKKWTPEGSSSCVAGKEYLCVHPDGQVLRCLSQTISGSSIGHIKDFELYKEPKPCAGGCVFPCDRATKNRR
jgi:MoaA/NifB/PqqE/SkfB family radical SAM enzyme